MKLRGCIYPCSGHAILLKRKGQVPVQADDMPAYVSCSECGYTPGYDQQPQLVAEFLQEWVDKKLGTFKKKPPRKKPVTKKKKG